MSRRRNNLENQEQAIRFVKQRLAGLSFAEIAPAHNYSHRTLEFKIDNLRKQFEAKDFPHLVGILIEKGLITGEPVDLQKNIGDLEILSCLRIALQENIKRINAEISEIADAIIRLHESLKRVNEMITKMEEK